MSNYVNNVRIGTSGFYTLGPLASTASGGIVDNAAGSYSSYNNCIIHTYTSVDSSASEISNTLMLNTNVTVGSNARMYNLGFIGGYVTVGSSCDCAHDMFINCSISSSGDYYCSSAQDIRNTFIGVCCSNNRLDASMFLKGANNVMTGSDTYSISTGMGLHGVATKRIGLYSHSSTNTGIYLPMNCVGIYGLTLVNAGLQDDFKFIVKGGSIQWGKYNIYRTGDGNYYYYASNSEGHGITGFSLDSSNCLYVSGLNSYASDGIAQLTLSYDLIPYST